MININLHRRLPARVHRRASGPSWGLYEARFTLARRVSFRRRVTRGSSVASRGRRERSSRRRRSRRRLSRRRAVPVDVLVDVAPGRSPPPVPQLPRHVRAPQHAGDEAREPDVRGEEARRADPRQATHVRVTAPGSIHSAPLDPRSAVLQDVPGQVEHDEGHGGEGEQERTAFVPSGPAARLGFPVHHLRDVGEHRERDPEGDGMRQPLGSLGRGDPREGREEQGPASGAHERRDGQRDGKQRRPHANLVLRGERGAMLRRGPHHRRRARLDVSRGALLEDAVLVAGREEERVVQTAVAGRLSAHASAGRRRRDEWDLANRPSRARDAGRGASLVSPLTFTIRSGAERKSRYRALSNGATAFASHLYRYSAT